VSVVATEFDVGRGKKFERVAVEGDRAIAANRMRALWLSDFAMDVESQRACHQFRMSTDCAGVSPY